MNKTLSLEFLKIRSNGLLWGIIFFPIVFSLMVYLGFLNTNKYSIELLVGFFIYISWAFLLITIPMLVTLIIGIEYDASMWSKILTFPIQKWKLYISKFIICLICTQVIGILFLMNFIGISLLLGFSIENLIPYFVQKIYFPFLLVIPYLAFQIIISIFFNTQSIAIILGILIAIVCPLFKGWGWWTPWGYLITYIPSKPAIITSFNINIECIGKGVFLTILCMVVGSILMYKKEF